MSESCRYMPQPESTPRGKAQKVYRMCSYDIWRRELRKFKRTIRRRITIVDVGCGPGFLLSCIRSWFPDDELLGVDASDELLEVARSRCRTLSTIKGDACSLPLPDKSADVIFALHIVEHLERPRDFLSQVWRVLRPGGLLVLATPNAKGLGARIMKSRWQGFDDPTHISLNAPSFWRQALQDAGLEIKNDGTTGLSGVPILNRMPFSLLHGIPGFFFGFYRWNLGEAYVCTAIKPPNQSSRLQVPESLDPVHETTRA